MRRAHGFTLLEIMMVAAIIGVLSSVAIPEFAHAGLRARAAERRNIMVAIAHSYSDLALNKGSSPALTGDWNPAVPKIYKQRLDMTQPGWNALAIEFEGFTYYSYKFVANPNGTNPLDGTPQPTLDVSAVGDLDGDGALSTKTISYVGFGHAYQLVVETPAEGQEDLTTF